MFHFLLQKNAFIAIIVSNAVIKSKELFPKRETGIKKFVSNKVPLSIPMSESPSLIY
jgi:hypothetical protein